MDNKKDVMQRIPCVILIPILIMTLVLPLKGCMGAPMEGGRGVLRQRCLTIKCLSSIKNSTMLDRICRKESPLVSGNLCYCCGGTKSFHIYGDVCLRYCLKTRNPITNQLSGEPCRPRVKPTLEDSSFEDESLKFFPDFPSLLPEDELDCS
eukprot:TRINITY_DN22968_c0_g1_i1.p1 TRINITY_DN22968_c0_g1~~TRINITY_DN22968_c0_g1_i1.p1  ORF type:complete len:151 (+),score=21.72 TRINITY_DN22968_c0_g1_i1:27-479(+)